ncbi:hypothetical protein CERZMDRAFT_94114 [Cercospora zeae-maydis SCOH1-5]|uniref:Uncharacterized protein n=1 Tax=Cercospora zeae-maydis SCOH1-5 TaxID=717836 RepID=A0A6A6FQG9_9PEZI|nr:hypothetical protein CERZMDRAFT_94114 [Cercospora zeae-maydis SCOH1-5]
MEYAVDGKMGKVLGTKHLDVTNQSSAVKRTGNDEISTRAIHLNGKEQMLQRPKKPYGGTGKKTPKRTRDCASAMILNSQAKASMSNSSIPSRSDVVTFGAATASSEPRSTTAASNELLERVQHCPQLTGP